MKPKRLEKLHQEMFLEKKILWNFIQMLFFLFQRFEKLTEPSNCNENILIYFMDFFSE